MESANLCTALVAMGQMAVLAPKAQFVSKLKPIVQNILVKQILMQDQVIVIEWYPTMCFSGIPSHIQSRGSDFNQVTVGIPVW